MKLWLIKKITKSFFVNSSKDSWHQRKVVAKMEKLELELHQYKHQKTTLWDGTKNQYSAHFLDFVIFIIFFLKIISISFRDFEIFLITVMFFSFSAPRDHSTSIRVGILEARSLIISTNASISPQGVPISGLTDPIRLVLCMGRIVDAFASVYRCVNNFSKSTTTGLSTNPLMSGTLTPGLPAWWILCTIP